MHREPLIELEQVKTAGRRPGSAVPVQSRSSWYLQCSLEDYLHAV